MNRAGAIVPLAAIVLAVSGCFDWSSMTRPTAEPDAAAVEATSREEATDVETDPFAAAELDPGEQPFLAAARPFIEAVAQRNYAAAFGHLSPTARQRFSRNQFIPVEDEQQYAKNDAEPLLNPTADQFTELMAEVEAVYGTPVRLDVPTVETDPEILSRREPLLAAYEIGALPDTIPVEQRKAAVQAWIYCRPSDEQIKQAAEQEGIPEAQYREMLTEAESYGEGPYFKLKTVVIDEGAGPVIGYFEIAPRSILD